MNYIELISEIENPPREFSAMKSFSASKLESLEKDNWQMGIVITDDEGEDIPLMPGMPKEAGDVIISLETVARNAQEWNNSYDEELRRVIIHGILHLNGLDHPGDDYSTGMLKLQEELLGETGSLLNNKL